MTEQGQAKLPSQSEREARLARHNLAERDRAVLRAVDEAGRCTASTVRDRLEDSLSAMELIPILTHLVREGYLTESGWLRRYVDLTDDGRAVLDSLDDGR